MKAPRILKLLSCLLALSLSLSLPGPALAQDSTDAAAPPPVRPAKLMTLTPDTAMLRREFFGRVAARETVDLAFQVGGQIARFPVAEGNTYEKGALIASLDLTTFERAVSQAEVNLAKAQRDLDRLNDLSSANVAEMQVQDARTQRDLARIALETAEDQLSDATLQAPFEALVVRRLAETFSTVPSGAPVVRLSDMSEIRVDIDVPDVLFRRAQSTDEVRFSATLPGSDTTYPLEIREYEAETAELAQTFRVTLAFTQKPDALALPGASVTVAAQARLGETTEIILPGTALVYGPDRDAFVMVFEPSQDNPDIGTIRQAGVTIRVLDDGRIALGDGPAPGTEILRAGAAMVEDGQRVRRYTRIGQ